MKLTARGHYSVKAMLDLAMHADGRPQPIRAIARRQNISQHFLEQILIQLRQAGFVQSVRGVQGGYLLARSAREIHLGDLLRAVGDGIEPLARVAHQAEKAEDWVTLALWNKLSRTVRQALDQMTLEELYFDVRSRQASQGAEGQFIV